MFRRLFASLAAAASLLLFCQAPAHADGLIVVTNDKIVAVSPSAAIPSGAETIDLGDATLLPGLMDAHTHIADPFERDYRNQELALLKKPVSERTLLATLKARVSSPSNQPQQAPQFLAVA